MHNIIMSVVRAVAATAAITLALAATSPSTAAAQAITSRLTTDRCMDIPGGSRNQGAQIALWSCHGGENQQFVLQPSGQIRTAGGLCINALGGTGTDGEKVGIWPCAGGRNELWQVTGNGEIRGINGKCIDVPGGNSAPGTGLVLWSCNGGLNQRWNFGAAPRQAAADQPSAPAAQPAPSRRPERAPTVKKLYVIDGTDSKAEHHNSMYHMYEQWQGAKYWQDGVDRMATNIDQAYQQVYTTLCQDVKPASQGGSGVTDVYIAGYSRGAFMAVKLANQARRSCGAKVRFVGLVDAVNSGIYNWGNRIIADADVAVHIRKMSGWEHVLTTRDIAGARRILNPEDINHQTIVCNKDGNDTAWRWTRDELIKYAREAGGVFAEPQRHTTDC